MASTYTVVIESEDGEDINMDLLCRILESNDLRARTWGEGDHLWVKAALQQARERLDNAKTALDVALGEYVEKTDD